VRLDAAAPNAWTTEHYVTKERWHAFADVGRKDNGSPGDIYAAARGTVALTDAGSKGSLVTIRYRP